MRILVLTDTTDYGAEATFYPLMRGLAGHDAVESVYVADRSIPDNLYFYTANDLGLGQVYARRADSGFRFENQKNYKPEYISIDTVDAVWMRLDLAEDRFLQYVETLFPERFISNQPAGMIRTGSKAFLLSLQPLMDDLMPRIKLCYDLDNVRDFQALCPDIVLKVLRSFGGKGVARVRSQGESDLRSDADITQFFAENGPALAMEYLDHPQQSDNRLVISNGDILGVLRRVPRPGDWRCNLMAGGSYDAGEPDAREMEIVRRVDQAMRRLGIHYYGIDTLMNARSERVLSEINTINAGGAYRYELKTGKPVCRRIAGDFVSNALHATRRPGRPNTL